MARFQIPAPLPSVALFSDKTVLKGFGVITAEAFSYIKTPPFSKGVLFTAKNPNKIKTVITVNNPNSKKDFAKLLGQTFLLGLKNSEQSISQNK